MFILDLDRCGWVTFLLVLGPHVSPDTGGEEPGGAQGALHPPGLEAGGGGGVGGGGRSAG